MQSAARQGHAGAKRALARLQRQRGSLPAPVLHLWEWWTELAHGRRSGGFGPEPIGWSDIDAWSRLTGSRPRPHEIGVLMRLDREWLAAQDKGGTDGS